MFSRAFCPPPSLPSSSASEKVRLGVLTFFVVAVSATKIKKTKDINCFWSIDNVYTVAHHQVLIKLLPWRVRVGVSVAARARHHDSRYVTYNNWNKRHTSRAARRHTWAHSTRHWHTPRGVPSLSLSLCERCQSASPFCCKLHTQCLTHPLKRSGGRVLIKFGVRRVLASARRRIAAARWGAYVLGKLNEWQRGLFCVTHTHTTFANVCYY